MNKFEYNLNLGILQEDYNYVTFPSNPMIQSCQIVVVTRCFGGYRAREGDFLLFEILFGGFEEDRSY
ncbi:hypothetical protein SLEP1_g27994 [Rubroshorea leprosula]|uniref:Uncharacterized protein n=1 Tax=Rubroshorea leprosula TaxID=152421 RepID=A0AAV5JSC1_9ROSI|nr:hypothetical protein SLEP1_g27994 [Rubroshorea leprosula]